MSGVSKMSVCKLTSHLSISSPPICFDSSRSSSSTSPSSAMVSGMLRVLSMERSTMNSNTPSLTDCAIAYACASRSNGLLVERTIWSWRMAAAPTAAGSSSSSDSSSSSSSSPSFRFTTYSIMSSSTSSSGSFRREKNFNCSDMISFSLIAKPQQTMAPNRNTKRSLPRKTFRCRTRLSPSPMMRTSSASPPAKRLDAEKEGPAATGRAFEAVLVAVATTTVTALATVAAAVSRPRRGRSGLGSASSLLPLLSGLSGDRRPASARSAEDHASSAPLPAAPADASPLAAAAAAARRFPESAKFSMRRSRSRRSAMQRA
mmetsp:Transcript_66752/g.217295  ORF Transcript_66752/g.217295 Transcript_66752/m.217295 type:complete len:317 (+) Transcript_66752:366-1316(+)